MAEWLRTSAPYAVGVLLAVVIGFWVPDDGWGRYVRWGLTGAVCVVLVRGVVFSVQEFRRGYAGDD